MDTKWSTLQDSISTLSLLLEDEQLRKKASDPSQLCGHPRACLLVTTGAWNGGKSTLLNALLQRPELLPTGPIPTTALVTELRSSMVESYKLIADDRVVQLDEHQQFTEYVASDKEDHISPEWFVQVGLPDFPFPNTVLVDTPGTNAPVEAHEAITRAYIPRADAVLYTMPATAVGQSTDIMSLRSIFARTKAEYVFIIVTQKEKLSPSELESLEKYIDTFLSSVGTPKAIHYTDAYLALSSMETNDEEGLKRSGIPQLQEDLTSFLAHSGSQTVWNREWQTLARIATLQKDIWQAELSDLSLTQEELQHRLEQAEYSLGEFENALASQLRQAASELRTIGVEQQEKLFHQILSHWEQLEPHFRDIQPSNLSDLKNKLRRHIGVLVDESTTQAMKEVTTLLEKEVAGLLESLPTFSIEHHDSIKFSDSPPDIKEFIKQSLHHFDQTMEVILPFTEYFEEESKFVTYTHKAQGWRNKAGTLFNKMLPILMMLQEFLEKQHVEQQLKTETQAHLMNLARTVQKDFATWWTSLLQQIIPALETELRSSAEHQVKPLRDAHTRVSHERESITKRTQELQSKTIELHALLELASKAKTNKLD